ncbi:MAG TPA: PEP-CTERM sorting domain-containing protein, partial [Phycisphaerae bacterium]|nr:PEP-CTERM sorting domain-containing protein [Phycisphaerae bacterium]
FSYVGVPSLPANLQGNQQAILTLSSSTVAPVISLGANFYDQQIMANGALPDILTVTRNTPAGEGSGAQTNLLTMVFTGQLVGQLNSRTPQVSGDTTLGNTVVYSTDFSAYLPFLSSSLTNDFSLTFSSWTTLLNGLGLQVDGSDNYFDTAYAAGAATFDAQATVPEPGTLGIAALGLTGILLRRRSKAKTKK